MTMQIGRCGLCLNIEELRDSHLMPAALYKSVQDSRVGTVVSVRRRSFFTSVQVSARFLCDACEQRFHRYGEAYVLTQHYQPHGPFKLRELLQAASPLDSRPQGTMYDVQPLLGNKIEHYLYFAASIVWRASARRWKLGRALLDEISLGPYQEPFRLYLLNQIPFPQNARIWVFVASEDQPIRGIVPPCMSRIDSAHRHDLYIPGLHFGLILGKHPPNTMMMERLTAVGSK